MNNSKDEIFWGSNPKGNFTVVKHAYFLAQNLSIVEDVSTSNPLKLKAMWKDQWKTKVIPKEKTCAWREIQNILPTQANVTAKYPQMTSYRPLFSQSQTQLNVIFS